MNTVNDNYPPPNKREKGDSSVVAGVLLISLGILSYFPQIDFKDLWPFLLIIVGAMIIWRGRRN